MAGTVFIYSISRWIRFQTFPTGSFMSDSPEKFVIRTTLTSPFGRKVRLAADVLGLGDRVTLEHADVADENDSLRRQNPLGKMPCLVRADGSAVFDSGVIVEFLQEVAGTERLLPARGPARYALLTRVKLADGIIDAGALIAYESRWHTPEHVAEPWIAYQRGKITRALAAFEAAPPDDRIDALTVVLVCALEFLDRRKSLDTDWRATFPRLARWFDDFVRREPAAFARIKTGDA
jgi:glutathione S-transferase